MALQNYLADAAEAGADATALVMGEERLSYGQVAELSDRLATALVEHGCRNGDRVGLLIPKCPAAIVAMHAALKVGCAYVPLDTESPAPRIAHVIRAAEPSLILTRPDQSALLDELVAEVALPAVGLVEAGGLTGSSVGAAFDRDAWRDADPLSGPHRPAEDEIAHLLFTSGSTGLPKGVAITHRNVGAFVEWALAEFGAEPRDRISGHPPLHFDLSTFDIFGSFAAGAELHLVPPRLNLNPKAMAALIRDSQLTQWFSVPSALAFMAKFGVIGEGDFPSLKRLIWCGEVLPIPILRYWMERLPHVSFTNLYGPTEATIASSFFHVTEPPRDDGEAIPIGVACAGEELIVLDEDLAQVASGEIGDLYIGGAGLSPGYWRDEEKTAAAFLRDPRGSGGARIYRTGDLARRDEEGLFHFLGRADSQIKSRGYRIELGEIEIALGAIGNVAECAVVGIDIGGFEGTTIAAAIVFDGDAELEPPELRRRLLEVLPGYMIPARWSALPVLPKNQNGKIDRPALRRRFEAEAESPVA